jgi:hypothetical protein
LHRFEYQLQSQHPKGQGHTITAGFAQGVNHDRIEGEEADDRQKGRTVAEPAARHAEDHPQIEHAGEQTGEAQGELGQMKSSG